METVENIVETNTRLGVPIETQYIDIDYMERAMGFTIGETFQGKVFIILINLMSASNVGSVVEFSPATREARVRFPDVANVLS